jgi:predicted metalloprotease
MAAFGVVGCGGPSHKKATIGASASATRPVITARSQVPRLAGDPKAKRQPSGNRALTRLPRIHRPTSSAVAPNIKGLEGLSLEQSLDTVGNDVGTFWQQQFNQAGYAFAPANQDIVEDQGQTGCDPPKTFTTDDGPFYCSIDATINLPVGFFKREAVPIGSTAVAIVVAHEWGHRVQDLLGLFQLAQQGKVKGIQLELQADCLAGVWASSVYRRGLLEPGDLRAAITVTNKAGDAPGTPVNAPGAHGSSQMRVGSFMNGYSGADPSACALPNV